jgi:hypothetical protein
MLTDADELELSIIDAVNTADVQKRRHSNHIIAQVDERLREVDRFVTPVCSDDDISKHVNDLYGVVRRMMKVKYPMELEDRKSAHKLMDDYEDLCSEISGDHSWSARSSRLSSTRTSNQDSHLPYNFPEEYRSDILSLGRRLTRLTDKCLSEYHSRFRTPYVKDDFDEEDEGYRTEPEDEGGSPPMSIVPSTNVAPVVVPTAQVPVAYPPVQAVYPGVVPVGTPATSLAPTTYVPTSVPTTGVATSNHTGHCQHDHCTEHCSHPHDHGEAVSVEVTVDGKPYRD